MKESLNNEERRSDRADLEDLICSAIAGDLESIESLVRSLQDEIYRLALRMTGNREDAEDSTQEILIRIVTRLAQFEFRSSLRTWVFRIAVNYILDLKRSRIERLNFSFEQMGMGLAEGLGPVAPADTDHLLLVEEVRIGCSLGMLQCLDRPHRLAFVLGEIFEMTGPEAGEVLGISPSLFRKRLQLARSAMLAFTQRHCGLVADTAACSCNRQVPAALQSGRIRTNAVDFANKPASFLDARTVVRKVDEARRAFALHRAAQPRASSIDFARQLVERLDLIQSQMEKNR